MEWSHQNHQSVFVLIQGITSCSNLPPIGYFLGGYCELFESGARSRLPIRAVGRLNFRFDDLNRYRKSINKKNSKIFLENFEVRGGNAPVHFLCVPAKQKSDHKFVVLGVIERRRFQNNHRHVGDGSEMQKLLNRAPDGIFRLFGYSPLRINLAAIVNDH